MWQLVKQFNWTFAVFWSLYLSAYCYGFYWLVIK